VNAAAKLLASGMSVAQSARTLARRFAVSERQARRYSEEARDLGSRVIPKSKVVFTVKIPVDLVKQLRHNSKISQCTLSSLVARALEEFLARTPGRMHGGG
jgi:hypothetical protein